MNAVGRRRLLKLADFLETEVPAKHFDMSCFAHSITDAGMLRCGTAACAAGWAASIPSFRRAGYRLVIKSPYTSWVEPDVRGEFADAALRSFFGIEQKDVVRIFGADNPNSPKAAAKRIRSVVAREQAADAKSTRPVRSANGA